MSINTTSQQIIACVQDIGYNKLGSDLRNVEDAIEMLIKEKTRIEKEQRDANQENFDFEREEKRCPGCGDKDCAGYCQYV